MEIKVLIATPERSFGEKLSQALREAGYRPLFVQGIAEATFVSQDENYPIAILDCDLPDPGTAYLAVELRSHNRDLRIVFIHKNGNNNKEIELKNAGDIDLPRPFFLPDLLEVINLWVSEKKAAAENTKTYPKTVEIPPKMIWLKDVNQAAQYLTRLSLESNAQAALIILKSKIWAYAGHLSQTAADELANFVGHYWVNGNGSDVARFVRLDTTGNEHMLYATSLGSGFVLALSFETKMPFSEMRAQAGKLARRLTSQSGEIPNEVQSETVSKGQISSLELDEYSSTAWVPEDNLVSDSADEDLTSDETISAREQAMFDDLLATLNIPDPDGAQFSQPDHHKHQSLDKSFDPKETAFRAQETITGIGTKPLTKTDCRLEPQTAALHDFAYACLLIPLFPEHHLTGVLTGLLNVEMMRLCLAFGWRLEHLAIRPQYLHWVVSVRPDVPAAEVIEKIRDQTSVLLFEKFPHLAKENPSGDFWAQGFLVVHGRRALAVSLVEEFIQQSRIQQGINKPTHLWESH